MTTVTVESITTNASWHINKEDKSMQSTKSRRMTTRHVALVSA